VEIEEFGNNVEGLGAESLLQFVARELVLEQPLVERNRGVKRCVD